jgi:biotin transporter BioY
MSQNALSSEVIDILSRFDEQTSSGKSFLKLISQPPARFHLTTLLVMIWGGVLLGMAAMMSLCLADPIAWMQNRYDMLMYSFQVPMVVLVAAILGKRFGTVTIFLFLLAGFAGLPLFAGGGGIQYFESLTVGYLLGFIVVPTAIQPFLNKAYCNTGWFKGRSLWMAIGAMVAVAVIHGVGAAGLGVHILRGALPLTEAAFWMQQLSWPVIAYDLVFSWIAIASVRIFRTLFWFCLY